MKLKGKRAVVTGASSGIGAALFKRLIRAGVNAIGVARDITPIEIKYGPERAISCDVSDPAAVDAMLKEARRRLGGVDIFVANAGFAYYGPIGPPDWDKTMQIFKVNVVSPIYTLQKLTEACDGRLTFMVTVSGLGKMVLPGFALYDSTKFALDGFIRTYRMEKPRKVRIIPVYPVATYTPFFRKAGGSDAPMPLFPRQLACMNALAMEAGLRLGLRVVYPSLFFIARCILARVTPVDVLVQSWERPRFWLWKRRHGIK